MKKVILTGIHRGTGARSHLVYAQLREAEVDPKTGLHELCVSATLNYILQVAVQRRYEIVNLQKALAENVDIIFGSENEIVSRRS